MDETGGMLVGVNAREDYEQALIKWAQGYNGYERIAESNELQTQLVWSLEEHLCRTGEIPEGLGVDMLRGWAFFVVRGHRWSGHGPLLDDCPGLEAVVEAVRRHPAATVRDLPPPRPDDGT